MHQGLRMREKIHHKLIMDQFLKIMTYNSTGMAANKQQFLNDMFEAHEPDVIFIQETWLINSRISPVLCNINCNYMANGISGMNEDELLMGRPFGGLGILWKKSLATNASFCSVPGTNRACALQLMWKNNDVDKCVYAS